MSSGSDLYNKIAWQNGPSSYNVTSNLGPAMVTIVGQYNWQYPLQSGWKNVVGDKTYRTKVIGDVAPVLGDPTPAGGALQARASSALITGGGSVDVTALGAVHHIEAQSLPGQQPVTATNTQQRFFQFTRDDQAALPSTVYFGGLLEGTLSADADAVASILSSVVIRNTANNELAKTVWSLSVGSGSGLTGLQSVHEYVYCQADLMPGTIYEFFSSLEVYAKAGATGGALADFAHSFTAEVSGVLIPEPASLLLAVAALRLLRRRQG